EAESQGVKDLALLRVAVGEKVARPIRLAPLAEVKNKKRSFDALTVGCGKGGHRPARSGRSRPPRRCAATRRARRPCAGRSVARRSPGAPAGRCSTRRGG